MVVKENGRNIPSVVGPSNKPREATWGVRAIADLPSVVSLGRVERTLLPQILARRPIISRIRSLLRGEKAWPPGASIGELPSVIGILPGPRRTLHPKKMYKGLSVEL